MTKMTKSKPPKTLSTEAKSWWRKIVDNFEIDDDADSLLLQTALESFDRMRQAQAILAKDGIVIEDRFKQLRQHPATLVERDAKTAMQRALKALCLDVEAPGPMGRPPGR
jgi:P27 family predicted phage terminase small subunit